MRCVAVQEGEGGQRLLAASKQVAVAMPPFELDASGWQCHHGQMRTVVETPDYLRDAKAAGIGEDERQSIVDCVAANPMAGDMIVGSGGARKIRFPAPGRGKSGGYRVVTYYGGGELPVFLLNVFKKGDRINLSRAEINELRDELSHLAREYREGARKHVKGR